MPLVHTNKFQEGQQRAESESGKPYEKRVNFAFGKIYDIDEDSHQVKVKLLDGSFVGDDPRVGVFIPLMNDISDILFRWGPLRKFLAVKVMWRGRLPSNGAVAEIIGDEDSRFLEQLKIDEGGVGAYKIFRPGVF